MSTARIDPELKARGRVLGRLMARRSEEDLRRPSGRFQEFLGRRLTSRVPAGITRAEAYATRPDGSRLRLLVHRPAFAPPGGTGLLWLHGGGYVTGSPDTETSSIRAFVEGAGAVVVCPDYRLGVEAPYPAALDDCYTSLLWLRDHADELGVRTDRLAVGGASAGGGLTAATTIRARDRGEVAVAFQMPIYPMIDDRPTPSSVDNHAPVWDSQTNRSAWRIYLGDLAGGDAVPAEAAPARLADHRGLPPTLTYVGDVEAFHDETVAYVDALRAAGVPVEFRVFPGAWHGFDIIAPRAAVSRAARSFRDQWFGHAVRSFVAPQP